MLDKKKVTHYQQNKEKATPQKRVVFYKGRIAGIGENCLSITSTTVNINDKNIKIKTYDDLAYVLFQVWKNSPPHYQNMIKPEYSLSGLHVSYSKKENFYYAANVFGEYEYTPPTIFDFPKPDYGINYDYKRKYKAVADKVFSRSAINFINLKKDSVYSFYLKNKSNIEEKLLQLHRYTELKYDINIRLNKQTSIENLILLYDNINQLSYINKIRLLKIILLKFEDRNNRFNINKDDFYITQESKYYLPVQFYTNNTFDLKNYYKSNTGLITNNDTILYNFIIASFNHYKNTNTPFFELSKYEMLIKKISTNTLNIEQKNTLLLNLYLIYVKHYFKNKKPTKVNSSLLKFKKTYFSFNPNIMDIIYIGHFLNHYNHFDLTLEMLKPKLNIYPDNAALYYTYLKTYCFFNYPDFNNEELNPIIDKCIELDKNYFCYWINIEDFQLLRLSIFKDKYCLFCE